MRLFIGIKLNQIVINKIKTINNYLYSQNIRGNYTNYNNLHLTLVFLGEVKEENVKEIIKIVNETNISKLEEIELYEITNFKEMIILKVRNTKELNDIYNQLFNDLKRLHFNLQERPYFPHITLVRETNVEVQNILENKIITNEVNKITLFESKRINKELQYIPLN